MAYVKRNNKRMYVKPTVQTARYSHKCLNCGIDFLSSRTSTVYCSDACKQSHYRKRNAAQTLNEEWLKTVKFK